MLVKVTSPRGGLPMGEVIDVAHEQALAWIAEGSVVPFAKKPLPVIQQTDVVPEPEPEPEKPKKRRLPFAASKDPDE